MKWKFRILFFYIFAHFFLSQSTRAEKLLTQLDFNGSVSLNWRNVGPRKPGYEQQIQHQVSLADMYLGLTGSLNSKVPFLLEFNLPTAAQGKPALYRLSLYQHWWDDRLKLELGKFLVPFGYHNSLYRPDQFLSMTRPLLYASPDSLDLVLRLNSPRPPLSSGYTDIGAKLDFHPKSSYSFVPTEISFYVVNGLGEVNNRLRTFPYTGNLHVEPPNFNGVNIDFGHLNNNLADNNNDKTPGARLTFALGDLKLPPPLPEDKELKGVQLGVSGMSGRYDLEAALPEGQDYKILGTDLRFQYRRFSFTAEYVYSETDFRLPQANGKGHVNFSPPPDIPMNDLLPSGTEINRGYYLQAAFPIWSNKTWFSEKISGILALNRLERRGPKLIFSVNSNPANKLPVVAFPEKITLIDTSINKYTGGLNFKINKNLILKTEYSYWAINVPPLEYRDDFQTSVIPQTDVYQLGFSWVLSF